MIARLGRILLLSSLVATAQPEGGLVITDIDGHQHRLFAKPESRATVLAFVSVDCPIANFYQPTLRKLAKRFEPQGVSFFQLHPDSDLTPSAARKHATEFGIISPVAIDLNQTLVRRFAARITPEVFVVTPDLATAYRGRIDDTYTTFGKRRPEPTTRDLEAALTAVLAGKKVPAARTRAVGCTIFLEDE